MTMVEQVARALCLGDHMRERWSPNPTWEALPEETRARWRYDARTAIAAMREPTEGMQRIVRLHFGV